jgi:hypothetical protein
MAVFGNQVAGSTLTAPGQARGSARHRRRFLAHQLLQGLFEEDVADDDLLQRQADHVGGPLRRGAKARGGVLGEPDDAAVVAEVVLAQLRIPVQPELDDDRAVERRREVVGQHIGAGFGLVQRLQPCGTGEDAVAVGAGEAGHLPAGAHVVERAIGAAVGVPDGHPGVVRTQVGHLLLDRGGDPLRPVVQQRGQRDDVDGPAAAGGDVEDVAGDRAARHHGHAVVGPGRRVRPGRRGGRRTGR